MKLPTLPNSYTIAVYIIKIIQLVQSEICAIIHL